MANERYQDIDNTHKEHLKMSEQIQMENKLAMKLSKELQHERIVLKERKQVNTWTFRMTNHPNPGYLVNISSNKKMVT